MDIFQEQNSSSPPRHTQYLSPEEGVTVYPWNILAVLYCFLNEHHYLKDFGLPVRCFHWTFYTL